jgi:hypothetical protein
LHGLGPDGADGQIGLAVLPLDGFISLDGARSHYSEAVTRAFTFAGNNLELNMQAGPRGQGRVCDVRVEILDADYFPIPGYTFDDAVALTQTGVANRVTWKNNLDVSKLAGKTVKLKFYFKHAKLYAFQFVP